MVELNDRPKKILIIGAGLTGLITAMSLQRQKNRFSLIILEKERKPGGLCRTIENNGFYFDYAGHLLHFQRDKFKRFVRKKLSGKLVKSERESWVYSHGVFTRYPFQANLFGLPFNVITECLYGYFQAHFQSKKKKIKNLDDWIRVTFGEGIAKHFMIPYNTKLFNRHPSDLSPESIGRFVPKPDYRQVIRGALSGDVKSLGYNAIFCYPQQGGIEAFIQAIAKNLSCIRLDQEVKIIDLERKKVICSTGDVFDFDFIISTAPLPNLIRMISKVPSNIKRAASLLEYVSVLNINLGIRGNVGNKHWVYVPETKYIFYRIGFPHNFSHLMAPPNCSSISAEISYMPGKRPDAEKVINRVIDDLIKMKILPCKKSIISTVTIDIPYAYVVFNHQRNNALRIINSFLKNHGILSKGRFGSWDYLSMEDAYYEGLSVAANLNQMI